MADPYPYPYVPKRYVIHEEDAARSLRHYLLYCAHPTEKNLVIAHNSVIPMVRVAIYKLGIKSFDAMAAETEVAADIMLAFRAKVIRRDWQSATAFGYGIYRAAKTLAQRYVRANPIRRPDGIKDRQVCETVLLYRLGSMSTTDDVDLKIFLTEELPTLVRRNVLKKMRFNGEDGQYCIKVMLALLSGAALGSVRESTSAHVFLKRYTARLVREEIQELVADNIDEPNAESLRELWAATEYYAREALPVG